jgi:hypothetical protein
MPPSDYLRHCRRQARYADPFGAPPPWRMTIYWMAFTDHWRVAKRCRARTRFCATLRRPTANFTCGSRCPDDANPEVVVSLPEPNIDALPERWVTVLECPFRRFLTNHGDAPKSTTAACRVAGSTPQISSEHRPQRAARRSHSGSPPAWPERSPAGRGRAFDQFGLTSKVIEFVIESHPGMPCRLPHGYRGPGHRRIGERAKGDADKVRE